MRKDLLAAVAAGALIVGFVLFLGDVTWLAFGRHGPFDLRAVEEEWSLPDGTLASSRSEVLTFRGEDLFTVRSYDGDLPPDLRTAPIPDSLNRVARSVPADGAFPDIVAVDVPGLDIDIVRRDSAGNEAFLIRVTPDDAMTERSRGDATATVEGVAEQWRSAVADALQFVVDSVVAMRLPGGT